VSLDYRAVDARHQIWLDSVKEQVGVGELNPQPYWGFDDLFHKAATKLLNCFYVGAEVKKEGGKEYFWYKQIAMIERLSLDKFIEAIRQGTILVDFDAWTGRNHGTKFRMRQGQLAQLYDKETVI